MNLISLADTWYTGLHVSTILIVLIEIFFPNAKIGVLDSSDCVVQVVQQTRRGH